MNAEMTALIDQAEAEHKWLHCSYQDLWFSPAELRTAQAHGKFRWGVQNWTLRDPQEYLAEAQLRVVQAKFEVDRIAARVGGQA